MIRTQPLLHLQSRWLDAVATHSVLMTPATRHALKQAELDYIFLWRRTRHKMKWRVRAFATRPRRNTL